MRFLTALLPLLVLFLAVTAVAEPTLPPGYVEEEPEVPPEDPLPPPPAEFPMAPLGPVVNAPDPHTLLKECKESTFTDCFRLWQPPPPPPEEEKKEARQSPSPPDPSQPRQPAVGGPLTGPPPAPNPEADQATYEALVKALKETGVDKNILMLEPPKDGSATLQIDPKQTKTAPKK